MNAYIRTHQVGQRRYGNVFLVANNYSHSLAVFMQLFEAAKKAFPDIQLSDAEASTVIKSGWRQGCAVLRFSCDPDTQREGYINVEKLPDIEVR